MRLILAVVLALGLASCKTTEEWSEWEPISPEQSLIAVTRPPGVTLPQIERERREMRYPRTIEEYWQWPGGAGQLVLLPPGYCYRTDTNDPDALLEDYRAWTIAEDEGIEISRSDIVRRRNDIGFYFYALGRSASGDLVCFFSTQGLLTRAGPETMSSPGTSGGYIAISHCSDDGVSERALVADMTAILDNIDMR